MNIIIPTTKNVTVIIFIPVIENNVANKLEKHINDEEVAKLVCEKLHEIKFRLMVSKGLAQKKETVLSIEKYVQLPFDDAIKLLIENKDEIFKEILKKIEQT